MNAFENLKTAVSTFDCSDLAFQVDFEVRIEPNVFRTSKHQKCQNPQEEESIFYRRLHQVYRIDTDLTNTVSDRDRELASLGIDKRKGNGETPMWLAKERQIRLDRIRQLRVCIWPLAYHSQSIDKSPFRAKQRPLRNLVTVIAFEENDILFAMDRGIHKGLSTVTTPPQSFALATQDQSHCHTNVVQPNANSGLAKIRRRLAEAAF